MEQYKKEIFYDGLFVNKKVMKNKAVGGSVRVTNDKLEKILRRHFNKFKSQLEWDEFLGSAMTFIWYQIDRFQGDWDAILAGDEKEQGKLFSAISQAVYFGTMEVANPNSKFMSGEIIEVDFASLNELVTMDEGFELEIYDTEELESYFSAKEGYTETPFMKWVDANAEELLTENQYNFFMGYRSCLDNTQEEVESKTGVAHKQVSKKVTAVRNKLEKAWEKEKGFEHTYLYQQLMDEKQYMEELLNQDLDHLDFVREICADMFAGNKLGNLVLDTLSHDELIKVNTHTVDKQLNYKIIQTIISRINTIESFVENETKLYNKKKEPKTTTVKHFKYHIQSSDCLVFDGEGNLKDVIPAKPNDDKSKVKKLDGFGNKE